MPGAMSGQGTVLEKVGAPRLLEPPKALVEQGGLASCFTGSSEMTWKENTCPRLSSFNMTLCPPLAGYPSLLPHWQGSLSPSQESLPQLSPPTQLQCLAVTSDSS